MRDSKKIVVDGHFIKDYIVGLTKDVFSVIKNSESAFSNII